MASPIELKVHLAQDEKSGIWFIAASDIPGLRLEAATVHELIHKVEDVAPDLIELNLPEIMSSCEPKPSRRKARRPAVSIRPVFDSPMAVAC